MGKKKDEQLKKELLEGFEQVRRQSYVEGAKNALTAFISTLQKSSKEDFRKEHLLILISEIAKIFEDEEFLKSVFEKEN